MIPHRRGDLPFRADDRFGDDLATAVDALSDPLATGELTDEPRTDVATTKQSNAGHAAPAAGDAVDGAVTTTRSRRSQ